MILAGLAVLCQMLMFPPCAWTWLAWLAPLPFFLLFPAPTFAAAAGIAWLVGTVQALCINAPWLWPAMRGVFDAPPLALATMLAVESQLVGGLPFALLGICAQAGAQLRGGPFVVYAAGAWVGMEYLRAQLPLSAPWALLGSALAETVLPVQVADLGGVYTVSFLAASAGAAGARLLVAVRDRRPRDGAVAFAVAVAIVAAALLYGAYRLRVIRDLMATAPSVRVALVHGEVGNPRRIPAARAVANVEQYLRLSPADVDLVVWPENTVSALLEDNPDLVARIAARAAAAPYLVGAPRAVAGGRRRTLRASAFLIGPGGIEAVYDKRRLLPMAETLPGLGGGGLGQAIGFLPGSGAPTFDARGIRLGASICYEAVFPDFARDAVRAGAELLVNLSNDSWFAPGMGPRLHFLFGRLRAVETRRAVIRAANGGVTAIVLPDGTAITAEGPAPGALVDGAPRLTVSTLYTRAGDWFGRLCLGGVLVSAAFLGARRARR